MSAPRALSDADLGLFFDAHHRPLAEELIGAAGAIETAAGAGAGELARALGRDLDLYRLVCPDSGTVDVRAVCLARELLGYVSPLADAIFAVQGLGSFPIALAGTAEQRALLPAFRRGERIGAFALTEPGAGSDVASMATIARRDGGDFVLEGEKVFISNADIATDILVFANADPEAGRRGITAFLIAADAPGVSIEPVALGIEHPVGAIRLAGVRVPASAVVGELGGGFRLAMQTLDRFRVTVGAAAVGMARRAFDEAARHVRGRVQFGKPLAEQQIVQAYLAEMATEIDAARLLVLRAAHAADTTEAPVTTAAAMAKLYATEAAQRVIDRAVQLFGGLGVTRGNPAEALYRAIRPLRIYEGTSEIQRLIIGRAIAKEA